MWDFVGRTQCMLYNVNPTLEGMLAKEKEQWNAAQGASDVCSITDHGQGAKDAGWNG